MNAFRHSTKTQLHGKPSVITVVTEDPDLTPPHTHSKSQHPPPPPTDNKNNNNVPNNNHSVDPTKPAARSSILHDPLKLKEQTEGKLVGLKKYSLNPTDYKLRQQMSALDSTRTLEGEGEPTVSVEELEMKARTKTLKNPFYLLFLGNIAALKVMGFYLITLETIVTCLLTVGLTLYWYFEYKDDDTWNGGGMDFILLAFAVTSPISAAIGMAFQRRERALIAISDFRSFSYHLFCAHAFWDWTPGGRASTDVDWLEHCDAVLAQLIGIGDELARFLSLPTTSRSRHRMTKKGRKEASRTTEVAYYLLESISTQRITRLLLYSERLKKIGLPSGEISRIRQYERFLTDIVEQLRMVKMYRSPQALRSFARIFTLLLPPFYAPTFAQVAMEVNSLGVGIGFGIITALGLTAFRSNTPAALDGIDVREEFEVLHFAQLINTRKLAFPNAAPYPASRRMALTNRSKLVSLGIPPPQKHHRSESAFTVSPPAQSDAGSLPDKHVPGIKEEPTRHGREEKEEVSGNLPEEEVTGNVPPEEEPLLFSVDDMVHVGEELGLALESDIEASPVRDSHFINDHLDGLEENRSTTGGHSRTRSRHLSRTSQSISRLFMGE
eukprot:scaffold1508_cov178-Amphora_coffeaeformis.AAC.27